MLRLIFYGSILASGAAALCLDSTTHTFDNDDAIEVGCAWLTDDPIEEATRVAEYCPRPNVKYMCADTCDSCDEECADNPAYVFRQLILNEFVKCSWITEIPSLIDTRRDGYCDNVGIFCPEACGFCPDPATMEPSSKQSDMPSMIPSNEPSSSPSSMPSPTPSLKPSSSQSEEPSPYPSPMPSLTSSMKPSSTPSARPSVTPSFGPSVTPSSAPSKSHTTTSCSDSTTHTFNLDYNNAPVYCWWITRNYLKKDIRRANYCFRPNVRYMCAESCLACDEECADNPQYVFELEGSSGVYENCAWITEIPSQIGIRRETYCSTDVGAYCPDACGFCPGPITMNPTSLPSHQPSNTPSDQPSSSPSFMPSLAPSKVPSVSPSSEPSVEPTTNPSSVPSIKPSSFPSSIPSTTPSSAPSNKPSSSPSSVPSTTPSDIPSSSPSAQPTPTPECEDSPLTFWRSFEELSNCTDLTDGTIDPVKCDFSYIASHCPATCGSCNVEEYKCADSQAIFVNEGEVLYCEWLNDLEQRMIDQRCNDDDVKLTCRATCGYCGSFLINFDDADLSESPYYAQYTSDTIYMDNIGAFHGGNFQSLFPEYPGISKSVISEENSGAIYYPGNIAVIVCPEGNFDAVSLYTNSITGVSTSLDIVAFDESYQEVDDTSIALTTDDPVKLTFPSSFENIRAITISNADEVAIALEDIELFINAPCFGEFSDLSQEALDFIDLFQDDPAVGEPKTFLGFNYD